MWESFEFDMICPRSLSLFSESWKVLLRCFSAAHKSEVVSESSRGGSDAWAGGGWRAAALSRFRWPLHTGGKQLRNGRPAGPPPPILQSRQYLSYHTKPSCIYGWASNSVSPPLCWADWEWRAAVQSGGPFCPVCVTGPSRPAEDGGRGCGWVELLVFPHSSPMSWKRKHKEGKDEEHVYVFLLSLLG